jgi:ABC-2 type transport system ATP-binding protein
VTVLHQPKLLIFDEPFSGFDPINASLIKDEILKLRDDGATVIFSTHRMESVEEMCDHIALIHKSHKILDGKLIDIKRAYKSMKVGEQVLYLAQLKGLSKQEAKRRLKYWFDRFEIGDWWNKKIQELSKGMAQKIQFIVTVLHQPKLLIFDEPFSGFDPINASLIKDEILKLRDDGATVIFSTHRMESVEEMCDHIALIHKSNKILDGKLIDIKRAYKSNTFEVGLLTENKIEVGKAIQEKFEVFPASFKSINDELQYKIKIPVNSSPNDLVGYLTSKGQLNHFVEVVPTANDIFIETVQNN